MLERLKVKIELVDFCRMTIRTQQTTCQAGTYYFMVYRSSLE